MARRSLILLIAGGALAGLIGASLAGVPTGNTGIYVPDRLAGLPLTESRLGASAVAEIQRLHGEGFPVTSAAVAYYGAASEATVWVAGAATEWEAAALLSNMRAAIAAGNSPFTPLEAEVISGVTIYPLRGMGQEHIYFQAGRLVVWLAADPSVAAATRLAVLEAYR